MATGTGENINTYMGNAGLAQGTAGGEGAYGFAEMKNIGDATDKMMMYQFYENRDKWQRMNEESDQLAKDAAEQLAFKIENWAVPGDAAQVQKDMEEVYRIYAEDPSAVRARMDPKTGKFTNIEQYKKLHNAINNTNVHIAKANARTQQWNLLESQAATIDDPDTMAKYQGYKDGMYKSSIDQSIGLFANVKPRNLYEMKGPDVTTEKDFIAGDYVNNVKWTTTNLDSATNYWMTVTNGSESWKNTVGSMQQNMEAVRQKVWASLSDDDKKDPAKVMAKIRAEQGGDVLADYVMVHDDYVRYQNNVNDKAGLGWKKVGEIDFSKAISARDVVEMQIAYNAQKGKQETTRANEAVFQRGNLSARWAEIANQRENLAQGRVAKTEAEDFFGQSLISYVQNLYNPQPGVQQKTVNDLLKSGVQPQGLQYDSKNPNKVVQIQDTGEMFQNMFRRATDEKKTVQEWDEDEQKMVSKTVSAGNYPIKSAWLILDKNGDANKNQVVVQYTNPSTGKSFSHFYGKDKALQMAPGAFDDGTSAGAKARQAGAIGYQKVLSRNDVAEPEFNYGTAVSQKGKATTGGGGTEAGVPWVTMPDGSKQFKVNGKWITEQEYRKNKK